MSDLLTISRSSPEYNSYLLGTFSREKKAKPIQSLNLNSERESVTFEIVPNSEIQRPAWPQFVYQWLRMSRLIWVLFPFLFLLLNVEGPVFDSDILIFGILSLVFLTWSLHLSNDFSDHMIGLDRVSLSSGSRAIQKGWVTARTTQIWSWIFAGLALVLGAIISWGIPKLFLLISIVGFILYLSHFNKKMFFKNRLWGGWLQGLLIGPCLAIGVEIILKNQVTWTGLAFGLVWGVMVLFVLFLNEYEALVSAYQAGMKTWMGLLGFDRGRQFLIRWLLLVLFAYVGFHAIERPWPLWTPGVLILSYFSFKFLRNLKLLATPAGSGMSELKKEGYLLFVLATTLWTTEELFFFLMKKFLSL